MATKKKTAAPTEQAPVQPELGSTDAATDVKTGEFLPALKEIKPFTEFDKELALLREKNKTVFPINTPKGNAEARSHVHSMRLMKGRLDRTRKSTTAEALEFQRRVNSEAKVIEAELDALIEVHAIPLQKLEEQEAERKAGHEATLRELESLGALPALQPSNLIEVNLQKARDFVVDGSLDEYQERATAIKHTTCAALEVMLTTSRQYESDQAELARHRKAEEERQQQAREAEEQRQRDEQARLDREAEEQAERDRLAEEQRAEEQRKREAEAARVENHRKTLRAINEIGMGKLNGIPCSDFGLLRDELSKLVDRDFEEFEKIAEVDMDAANNSLDALAEKARQQRAQEEELERLRKEREEQQQREADAETERQRVAGLRTKIASFATFKANVGDSSDAIKRTEIALLKLEPKQAEFGELFEEAATAYVAAMRALIDAFGIVYKQEQEAEEQRQREEQAEADRQAAEKRENNKRHRAKINKEVIEAMVELSNATDQEAEGLRLLVDAIAAGKVPHVKIEY